MTIGVHCHYFCNIGIFNNEIAQTHQRSQNQIDRPRTSDFTGQKKIGVELATWIRNTCLETKTPKKKPIKTADPELLRQLAKIGGNLNQIARIANTEQARGDIINLLRLTAELATIREQLDKLLEHNQ